MRFTDLTPNLIVSDIDRSAAFYRDVLGFSTVTTVPEQAPFVFVWLQRDSVNVFLNAIGGVKDDLPAWSERPIGGTAGLFVNIEAADLASGVDAMFGAVEGRAQLVMPLKDQFYGLREFAIEDPDGYVIFFAQQITRQ